MVVLANRSGLPEDQFVNTWHFQAPGDKETNTNKIGNVLTAFYNAPQPNGVTVASFLSSSVDRGANKAQVKVYDMADEQPREPSTIEFQVDGTSSGDGFPNEVAVCLSFYAGRNIARRRGRVFIGPLKLSAGGMTTKDMIVQSGLRNTLATAASTLQAASDDASYLLWCVRSTVTGQYHGVTAGWIDSAFDIQRRRGTKATERTLWPVVG
jgi:hypothetical protein